MRRTLIGVLLAAALAGTGQAREPADVPLYDGHWVLRGADGPPARLRLSQWDGQWRHAATCRGRPLPVTVHHSHAGVLEFTAWGSAVAAGCPDVAYSLKPSTGGRSLEGTDSRGGVVRMTRAKG